MRTPFYTLSIFVLLVVAGVLTAAPTTVPSADVKWADILKEPKSFYSSEAARQIAGNVLLYQKPSGGWPKNIDMAKPLDDAAKTALVAAKGKDEATIDNDSTNTQIYFLAHVFAATHDARYRDAAIAGVGYILKAQYQNTGGWPQFFPLKGGYPNHITYNDNAMLHALQVLRDVGNQDRDLTFLPTTTVEKSKVAVQKGIDCILKTQIVVNGKKTAWCAQHDENTLAPAPARSYELVSISGSESVGLVKFLMQVDRPSPVVIDAVESAVAWFEQVKITGKELVESNGNRTLIDNPNGPVMWARFYEIGTNRPIYSNRNGVVHYEFSDLGPDRRNGYAWIRPWATDLLAKAYPAWKARIAATK